MLEDLFSIEIDGCNVGSSFKYEEESFIFVLFSKDQGLTVSRHHLIVVAICIMERCLTDSVG